MLTIAESVLGGICIGIFSGIGGAWFASKGKISCDLCDERRHACIKLIDEKLKAIEDKLSLILEGLKKNNLLSL